MKKLNALILSFSTVLFAHSAHGQWSIGGFAGQSNARSLNDCRGGDFATTTLTTATLDQEAFNTALFEANGNSFPEDDFLTELAGPGVFINGDGFIQSFETIDTNAFLEVLQRSADGEFDIVVESTTFFGTAEDLGIDVPEITERVIAADFTSDNTVSVFQVSDSDTFDPTDLGEFLGGVNDSGVGTTAADLITSFTTPQDQFTTTTITESFATFECNNDFSDFSYGFNIAYNFNTTWGIELGYVDLGEFSSSFSARGIEVVGLPLEENIDASAAYLAATGSYYYNKKWSITGRIGIYSLDVDRSIELNDQVIRRSDSDEDFYYGVSWNYDLSDPIQLQLRYDNLEADVFSLGIKYRFGR